MDRAAYLETLVPLAVRLVCVVHDEGPAAAAEVLNAVTALPAPDDTDPMTALAITLAAMTDPTRSTEQTLGWVRKLDNGPDALPIPPQNINTTLAIEMALAGNLPAHALTNEEGAEVVRILMERDGWTEPTIREHLASDQATIHKWANRVYMARRRAHEKEPAA